MQFGAVLQCASQDFSTVEPLNNGYIGGRDFVPCREVVHYQRSTVFLFIISPKITLQWLDEVTFNERFTNQWIHA